MVWVLTQAKMNRTGQEFDLLLIRSKNCTFCHSLFFGLFAVRSRTLLQVNEEYTAEPEDVSETTSFNVNNSDYLKAATPITLPGSVSHEVTVDVSEIDRTSQESKIKAHKR